jgi:hypothetical protein
MVIKSPYPPVDIPELDIPTFLFEEDRTKHIAFPRDRKLFIDYKTGWGLSLDELHSKSRRFGQGLKEKWNWQKGDVLCIFSANQVETGIILWGTHYGLGVGTASWIFMLTWSKPCESRIQGRRIVASIGRLRCKGNHNDPGTSFSCGTRWT